MLSEAKNTFGPLPNATAVVNSNFQYFIHVSRQLDSLTVGMNDLPPGLTSLEDPTNGLSIIGRPATAGTFPVTITISDGADGSQVSLPLSITVVTNPVLNVALGPLVITSSNIYFGTRSLPFGSVSCQRFDHLLFIAICYIIERCDTNKLCNSADNLFWINLGISCVVNAISGRQL